MAQTQPEAAARELIDRALTAAGWEVQDFAARAILANSGAVVVREFPMATGHGKADYLIFLDGQAVGAIEAKPAGTSFVTTESQLAKYAYGAPSSVKTFFKPLPFNYLANGVEVAFTNLLDPTPRRRRVFSFFRPGTLREWRDAMTLDAWVTQLLGEGGLHTSADAIRPATLAARLSTLPPLPYAGLRAVQVEAITGLESMLKLGKRRALIRMATGSGKTLAAACALERLIHYGGARRVLFLVDRGNLGEQAESEIAQFERPLDHKKIGELYPTRMLRSNKIPDSAKVVVTTIQRLYSILSGQENYDEATEDDDAAKGTFGGKTLADLSEPVPVKYSAKVPPEFFDFIFIDECHRSIYTVWQQVLTYFDATLIGLTATPSQRTWGFFEGNVVVDYGHDAAVVDAVNVPYDVYRIRTKITTSGTVIDAGPGEPIKYRTRKGEAWRKPDSDEELKFGAGALDADVVVPSQIRLIIQTYRERLFTELFPKRSGAHIPKTLIFAKNDRHADDIVAAVRSVFSDHPSGDAVCGKITYLPENEASPKDLISKFRTKYEMRFAVTVDMIATGTDIRPLEVVMFMRGVKSRILYEQMKGRGVRTASGADIQNVTPDATVKDRFILVDCVGVTEWGLDDSQPIDRRPQVTTKQLLGLVRNGNIEPDVLVALGARLARLNLRLKPDQRQELSALAGKPLAAVVSHLTQCDDPDGLDADARTMFGLAPDATPTAEQSTSALKSRCEAAVGPFVSSGELSQRIEALLVPDGMQWIDEFAADALVEGGVGFSTEPRERALATTAAFESWLAAHKDEFEAIKFFYQTPASSRLRYKDLKALSKAIAAPPQRWTPADLFAAYAQVRGEKVGPAARTGTRINADLIALLRFVLAGQGELTTFPAEVEGRYQAWLSAQATRGVSFSEDQQRWLDLIRDHIATSLEVDVSTDFELPTFVELGGIGAARRLFGVRLEEVVLELNSVLVA